MSDELIGQALGQYQIRVLLGRGGMSSVYLGYQANMDRTVAIKTLPREFQHDPTFLTRFKQEASAIAKLEHLHILPVYDAGEDRGIPYIVMRYLPGGTFADLIAERLPPYAVTARIAAQIADALDYAHERGIIHRDMKPSNILLDSGQNAYLADFGIARMKESADITGSKVMGTPPYIAPEMVRKDGVLSPSVDIYALGIIVFEAITGRPPFLSDDPMKTLMMHVMEPVPSARAADSHVKPEIDAALMKALAKTPAERYKTAGEFAAALAKAIQSPGRKPGESTPTGSRARRTATPPLRTPPPASALPVARRDEPRPPARAGQGRTGIVVLAGLAALVGGLALTAFAASNGNLQRLLAGLGRGGASTLTPTVTVTPGLPGGSTPDATLASPILVDPGGGGRVAFVSGRDGNSEIYLTDLDGGGIFRLTRNIAADYDPAWSPDGTKIVYTSTEDGDAELKVIDLAACASQPETCGETAEAITDNGVNDWQADWSPDGARIVFASNRDGNYELYIMRADGSTIERLTDTPGDEASPHWSPDGERVVYSAQEGSSSHLFIVSASGGGATQITGGDGLDLWPAWSPDGGRIVYTSTKGLPGNQRALFILDLTSETVAQISNGEKHDDDPAWSPDGLKIAFDSDRDGEKFDLYVLDIQTRNAERLTDALGDDIGPAWQP